MAAREQVFHFPCLHDQGQAPGRTPVSDHHPLTRKDIWILLNKAHHNGNWRTRNSIMIRLYQGIVGFTCPRSLDDESVRRSSAVGMIYLDHRFQRPTWSIVNKLFNAMHGKGLD